MAIFDRIPLMKPGGTKRNIVIIVSLFILLPFIIIGIPFYLLIAVGTNRNNLADRLADSPLGRLPGISNSGWTAGFATFGYSFLLLILLGSVFGGGESTDPVADSPDINETGDASAEEDAANAAETDDSNDGNGGTDEAAADTNGGNEDESADDTDSGNDNEDEAADDSNGGNDDEDASTDDTDSDTDAQGGIHQIASNTYSEPGLVTGVSHSGDTALFGFDDGNLMVYDENRDGEIIPLGIDRSISHIDIKENANTAAIGWMDAHAYGLLDLSENDGTVIQHPGLWDIDTTADGSTIASVSSPMEGTGSVGLSSEGNIQWETEMDNAAALSTAITNEGDYIAVGAAHYWGGDGARHGTPGVKFYDEEGNEQWTYDTSEDVISINVNSDRELVVAGTDDGKTIVLNFDGDILWETDEYGGWVVLSGDGSTIVTSTGEGTLAVNAETGEKRWSVDAGSFAFEDISVSNDGTRAFVAKRGDGEVFVIDEGEVIWEASYDVGPVNGDISGDGSTWSVIIQNNENQNAHIELYRDN